MGDVPAIFNGQPIVVPKEKLGELEASGGHAAAPAEFEAAKAPPTKFLHPENLSVSGIASDAASRALAGERAEFRGRSEAFGVPVDTAAVGIASLFGDGAERSTREYLKSLDEKYPVESGLRGMVGNVEGAIGAAELTGGAAALGKVKGATGLAARAAYGGAENVLQATTRDVNEAALGDQKLNGEKILAAAPERFLIGGLLTGGFEAGAHGIGAASSALRGRAVPALEEGASRAIGREVGAEDTLAAGQQIRGLAGGEIPKGRAELADLLTGEQTAQRARGAAEHSSIVDALEGRHTSEAAGLRTRQEGARKTAYAAGDAGVAGVERQGADATLEAMARGGERVEGAELAGAERLRGAHGEAFDANMGAADALGRAGSTATHEEMAAAGHEVDRVIEHYDVMRHTLAEEHVAATDAAQALKRERITNAEKLHEAILEAEKHAGIKPKEAEATAARAVHGDILEHEDFGLMANDPGANAGTLEHYRSRRGGPADGPEHVSGLEENKNPFAYPGDALDPAAVLEKRIENLETLGGESAGQKVVRLKSLSDQLKVAHEDALAHVGTVEKASNDLEKQATRDIAQAGAAADARIASFQRTTGSAAREAEKVANKAMDRLHSVQKETAAAVEKARLLGHKEAAVVEKKAASAVAAAKADAEAARLSFEATTSKEHAQLAKAQAAELKKVPKLDTATNVDAFVTGAQESAKRAAEVPLVSGHAIWGTKFGFLLGHPVAAAGDLAASFAAGRARAAGNLFTARALHGLSDQISKVDDAIRAGTALILGRTGARAIGAAVSDGKDEAPKAPKTPSFEEVSKDLYAAQANPAILERRVQAALGDTAKSAPQTYGETLSAMQRANAFLVNMLPRPQRDPNTLTPQLEPGTVDATSQYEFMQSYKTVVDPLSIYRDVHDLSVTEQQVLAIEEVFPALYKQMQAEVDRQKMYLTKPIDYERAIHVGTLLGVITDEVLEPDFQSALASNYKDKAAAGASPGAGSQSPGSESKTAKSMMSASESVEGGSP